MAIGCSLRAWAVLGISCRLSAFLFVQAAESDPYYLNFTEGQMEAQRACGSSTVSLGTEHTVSRDWGEQVGEAQMAEVGRASISLLHQLEAGSARGCRR